MKKNKKAAVILYVLILLFMASTLVFIVLSDMEKWNNYLSVSDLTLMEKKVLSQNAKINLDHHYKNNSDWDWFIDELKCPDFYITKKISDDEEKTETETITTTLTFENDNFYCSSWDYKLLLKKPSGLQYFFDFPETERWQNTIFSDFLIREEKYPLNNWIVVGNFIVFENINSDISKLKVEKWFTAWIDGIDDNLNNDDFKEDSTMVWFEDNDALARKVVLSYPIVKKWQKRYNIFSTSAESRKIISENKNNWDNENNPSSCSKCLDSKEKIYIWIWIDTPFLWNIEIVRKNKNTGVIDNISTGDIDNFTWMIYLKNFTVWEDYTSKVYYENGDIKDCEIWWTNFKKAYLDSNIYCFSELNVRDYDYDFFVIAGDNFIQKLDWDWLVFYIVERDWTYINPIKDDWDKIEILQSHVFNHSGKDILKTGHFSIPKP